MTRTEMHALIATFPNVFRVKGSPTPLRISKRDSFERTGGEIALYLEFESGGSYCPTTPEELRECLDTSQVRTWLDDGQGGGSWAWLSPEENRLALQREADLEDARLAQAYSEAYDPDRCEFYTMGER